MCTSYCTLMKYLGMEQFLGKEQFRRGYLSPVRIALVLFFSPMELCKLCTHSELPAGRSQNKNQLHCYMNKEKCNRYTGGDISLKYSVK